MKDEALKLALEALETPHPGIRTSFTDSIKYREQCKEAIAAINQALAAPVREPHKGLSEHLAQATNGRVYVDPVTGDVGIGTPEAPLQEPVGEVKDLFTQAAWEKLDVRGSTKVYLGTPPAAQPAPVQEPVAGQPLPCPFCGHIGLDFSDGETYRWGVASCGGCGASCGDVRREYPDQGEWHNEAIAEWNRRSPAAPDLQAELDATNRQVEILSDALAESRREVDAMIALARADEREACAKVCDTTPPYPFRPSIEAAHAIRARGNT